MVFLLGSVVLLTVVLGPVLDEPGPLLERAVAAAGHPLLDVLLLLVVMPLVLARSRNVTLGCVLVYGGGTLVADVVYGIQSLHGTYSEGSWVDLFWLAGFAALGAGALFPSLADSDRPVARSVDDSCGSACSAHRPS